METEISKGRRITILSIALICAAIFCIRIIDWQLMKGDIYLNKSNTSYNYGIETRAKRGEILDVNGKPLAMNESSRTIVFNKVYMKNDSENGLILELANLLNKKGEKWIDELPIELTGSGTYEYMSGKEDEIAKMQKNLKVNSYVTASDCMTKLCKDYKIVGYSKENERLLAGVRYGMLASGYEKSKTSPYTFAKDISSETVAIVSEKSYPGVEIGSSDIRKYVNASLAPHIVGTIGKLSKEQYDRLKDSYRMDDTIGKDGIESAYEKYLKGKDGKKVIKTTEKGAIIDSDVTNSAVPGNTVYLTIDAGLQQAANNTLARNVEAARSSNGACKSGSVVVLNVKDFSVLAAATYPSYDLQKYYENDDYKIQLTTDNTNRPLINRAFNGAFTPGSIYKPVVACAALEEQVIQSGSSVYCGGRFYYDPSNTSEYIRCSTGPHGGIAVINALSKSCNTFFADTGRKLGIETLDLYAARFGLGSTTGIEVAESKGILAGPEYSKSVGQTWYAGSTPQASLGQSDNLFTPVQLATYTATIANEGNRYKTHVVRKVTDYIRQNIIEENDPENPELIENVGVSHETFKIVKEGMRSVVTSGTASSFANYPIPVAGKTGTAQNNTNHDHTTFICIAPYDKPEIAIAVVLEYGSNGTYSKNIARDMLDAYFYKKGIDESQIQS